MEPPVFSLYIDWKQEFMPLTAPFFGKADKLLYVWQQRQPSELIDLWHKQLHFPVLVPL